MAKGVERRINTASLKYSDRSCFIRFGLSAAVRQRGGWGNLKYGIKKANGYCDRILEMLGKKQKFSFFFLLPVSFCLFSAVFSKSSVAEDILAVPTLLSPPATEGKGDKQMCPPPVLERLIRHKVAAGETLESIASQYNLIPTTLIGINPSLRQGKAPVGAEILIPPYNGIRVEVPARKTWQDVAKTYRIRADVLYEANGCQKNPRVVFIPGVNWSPASLAGRNNRKLAHYPLPATTAIALGYGWQLNPRSNQVAFHSGIDLLAEVGTPVLAVDKGTVAFIGDRGDSGNLVVINHPGGRQTRYAHLATIDASRGKQVNQGDVLGTVGTTGLPDVDKPHLHFELRYNSNLGWVAQDPQPYLQQVTVNR
ncbi:M23 family metallopeptidase [Coleofasciculus sp. FACHB-T130]|uniref:LysM peptidoglycan-binding domain-containing M23 family metallopeptidase n=1 Tax=Cyanophyceae TaxID=3028117 RepID=UPI0032201093